MSDERWPEPTTRWPRAATERCKALWNEGLSASAICKALDMGHSRSAVIGKIHRLRDYGHMLRAATIADNVRAPKPIKPPKEPRVRLAKYRVSPANGRVYPFGEPKPLPTAQPVDASHAKPWLERASGQCAYPISGEGAETFSCCAPTSQTYCKAHRKIMFHKPPTPVSGLVRVARRFAA